MDSNDAWIVKLNNAGEIEWQKTLGGSMDDLCFSIQQTSDGGYIAGCSNWSSDGDATTCKVYDDFWIVRLSPESSGTSQPSAVKLEISPNPAQGLVQLSLPLDQSVLQVAVTDPLGRIFPIEMKPDNRLDLSNYTNGLYFISIKTNDGKMWLGRVLKTQ